MGCARSCRHFCCCPLLQVQPEFMDAAEFKAKYIDPIKAGQERDATPHQKGQMTRRLSVLQDTTAVSGGCQGQQHGAGAWGGC